MMKIFVEKWYLKIEQLRAATVAIPIIKGLRNKSKGTAVKTVSYTHLDVYTRQILDRFGTDVIIQKTDREHFRSRQEVSVSWQFVGWLVGLGAGVRIVSPQNVVDAMEHRLEEMLGRSK